jgi:dihydrofolate reductase
MKGSVYIATSLDGFIARENGALDWLPGSGEGESGEGEGDEGESGDEDYGYYEFMESVDVLVMGRKTYEMVLSFGQWPYGDKRVVVLSSKQLQIPDDLAGTVESSSSSPTDLAQQLEESGAKHLYIDGGKTIQGFLNADLIQELIITTIPILIGSGIPLFGPLTGDRKLRHIETRSFKNGFVQSKYQVLQ